MMITKIKINSRSYPQLSCAAKVNKAFKEIIFMIAFLTLPHSLTFHVVNAFYDAFEALNQ